MRRALAATALLLATAACGGGDESGNGARPGSTVPPTSVGRTTSPPPTRPAGPEGVETFPVTAGHVAPEVTVAYAQRPPVGGLHHPGWQPCGFYDAPVPSELAVHSLEHGAIWITYRPDLPEEEKEALRRMAPWGGSVLVSRWEEDLPAPVVASSWGRQIRLESVNDPRLAQFVTAFKGDAPEPFGSCA